MQILIKLLSGKTLTLEVEGTTTIEELKSMIEADVDCPEAAEQCLLIGEGKGTRMENGMTVADYEVQKEAEIRLVPRQRPAPHASQTQMAEAMAQAMAFQQGIARRWDELYDSVAVLESRKRTAARRHGVRGKVKERLKLTVGGERVDVKRSTLCTPFPRSKLDALFSGRWECALLRDPRDTKRLFLDLNPACFRLLVEFCIDQQQHEPGEPLELPAVAPELESTLHLTFRLFGLDYLFEEKREGIAEADPPADAEPEPELEEDLEDGAAAEVEVVVADGDAVSLPPRTVDRVISARYGSLDQAGKWIDVTAAVAEQLDYDGAIELEVHSKTFAADPHEGAEKSLSVRYARCQKWERSSISDVFRTAQVATERARRALRTAIADHQLKVQQFEQEQTWIQQFFAAKPAPAAPEVVQISLLGEVVYTKRTTLMLCAESALARQFDAAVWAQHPKGGEGAESDSEDEEDADVVFVEQNAFCFKKIVDQLRLIAISPPGEPLPPPTVPTHEQKRFDKMVDYYFPGETAEFIKTKGQLRPLGGWESAQREWLSEKEQERMRREDPVTALLEDLQLADKEEMVYEYIGDTGGLAELALLTDEDLECLMEDMELDGLEMEVFRAAVMELRVEYD